jgi:hypothetical protein
MNNKVVEVLIVLSVLAMILAVRVAYLHPEALGFM